MKTTFADRQDIRSEYRGLEGQVNAETLAAILARLSDDPPHLIGHDAAELVSIGARVNRYGALDCNYGSTPRRDKTADKLILRARAIAAMYGLTIRTDGDCRGYILRLAGEGLPSNNLGGGYGLG